MSLRHSYQAHPTGAAALLPAPIEELIRADVAALASVGESAVEIVRVEAVTWRDGCLGVYRPEATCLLAVHDGYVVWATAGNGALRYHTDRSTTIALADDKVAVASIDEAPIPDSIVAVPAMRATLLSGSVPDSGFGLVVFGGGSYDDLLAASGCTAERARFWASFGGEFLVLVPASRVEAVNAAFDAQFAGSIASGTVLLGSCPGAKVALAGPPALLAHTTGADGPLGLGAYCWRFEDAESPRCDDSDLTTTPQVFTIARGGEIAIGSVPPGVTAIAATLVERPATGAETGALRISWVTTATPEPLDAALVGSRIVLTPTVPAGGYLLTLHLEWEAGDAVYGLQIDIED